MFLRAILAATFCILGSIANAQCSGEDLSGNLPPEAAEELEARIAATPFPEGLLWRAEKDGQTIHVVGTMHMRTATGDKLLRRISPMIESASLVLLEATPEEEKALQKAMVTRPELIFITDGPTLPEQLSAQDWQRLSDAARQRGIPSIMAAKFQPWYLSLMLGIPPCMMKELQSGNHGLDKQIANKAIASGTPLRALEPFDTMFSLFGRQPAEEQLRLLMTSIQPPEIAEDGLATMTAYYSQQQHAKAWLINRPLAVSSLPDTPPEEINTLFDELEKTVLVDRNRLWMPVIEQTAEHATVLVAVGAAHLSGEDGILNQLEKRGYQMERLPLE